MHRIEICFFSFPFITRNVRMHSVREDWSRLSCTHRGDIQIFSEPLPLRSDFMRLVQGHLKPLYLVDCTLFFYQFGLQTSRENSCFFDICYWFSTVFIQLFLFQFSISLLVFFNQGPVKSILFLFVYLLAGFFVRFFNGINTKYK